MNMCDTNLYKHKLTCSKEHMLVSSWFWTLQTRKGLRLNHFADYLFKEAHAHIRTPIMLPALPSEILT